MTESWGSKYAPKSIADLKLNAEPVAKIMRWLECYDSNKAKYINAKRSKDQAARACAVVYGPHGSGKTSAIRVLLNELGYQVHDINFTVIRDASKESKKQGGAQQHEEFTRLMTSQNILSMICAEKQPRNKRVVIIDSLESMTTPADKATVLHLQKNNDIKWHCPIIFIMNDNHSKLLCDMKDGCYQVEFKLATTPELKKLITRIAKKEKMTFGQDAMTALIYICQNDLRIVINTLAILNTMYKEEITVKLLEEYQATAKKKNSDIDLFYATGELLYNYNNISTCQNLYETEKVILPLMIHHNFPTAVINNIKDKRAQLAVAKKISHILTLGDVLENSIYGDQNWEMYEVHGIYTCVIPSYTLKRAYPKQVRHVDCKFAEDLTNNSVKQINVGNIMKINGCFRNFNVMDYIFLIKLVRCLLNRNNIVKCVKILLGYKIKVEHIDSLLKIDKINPLVRREVLTTDQKHQLRRLL